MTKFEILGRVLCVVDPVEAEKHLSNFQRMANEPKYVSVIFNDIETVYPDVSAETKRDYMIAAIYQIYQPLSFLHLDDKAAGKLPPGVRDELAKFLGFTNSEMCNHYKGQLESWMKPFNNGVRREFREKVMVIVERFKPLSLNRNDSQYKMELA
jgi:hypothetical protein